MIKLDVCYMSNLFRPITKHEQKYDQFTKTNSCLLENNTEVLGNDEKIYLFSSFDADIEIGIQSFDV